MVRAHATKKSSLVVHKLPSRSASTTPRGQQHKDSALHSPPPTTCPSTPTPPFAQTLRSLTQTKFDSLTDSRTAFAPRLAAVRSLLTDDAIPPAEKVRKMMDMNKQTNPNGPKCRPAGGEYTMDQYRQLLRLAEHDPSVSKETVGGWAKRLAAGFERENQMLAFEGLFAEMLQEWLVAGESERVPGLDIGRQEVEKVDEGLGEGEIHERQAKFEEVIFSPNDTDAAEIEKYLDKLFCDTPEGQKTLAAMRASITLNAAKFTTVDESDVKEAIKLLLKSDLLSNGKAVTLKAIADDQIVLKEFTDVVKMHFSSMDTWSWPKDGVPVEMRRQSNGKNEFYMDEELPLAVFLQCIGTFWSKTLYSQFAEFFDSPSWKPATSQLSPKASLRRELFLNEKANVFNEQPPRKSINVTRQTLQRDVYFMNQLRGGTKKLGLERSFLHLMITESLLSRNLKGQHTIVCTDFNSFWQNLSHTTILTIMKYFGAPDRWIKLFKTFMEAPMKLPQNGTEATADTIQVRRRGLPISHTLSSALGETMLFCMDYVVNKYCSNGMFLYRFEDNLWFWNSEPSQCVKAWETMTFFANTVGLSFNPERTGAICIGGPLDPRFPVGEIRWGLLELSYSGRFIIDQSLVSLHIQSLQNHLSSCKSIFSWVQTYNAYLRYFLRKFAAPPTRCFGVRHLEEIETTLKRIHTELFPSPHNGSIISHLSSQISSRFGITNIPTGWFFWPVRLGGLGVYNPFISLNAIRFGANLPYDPNEGFQKLVAHDREKYERVKKAWTREGEFMGFEEYLGGREGRDGNWASVYASLLEGKARMAEPRLFPAPNLREIVDVLAVSDGGRNVDAYWKWVMAVWGQEMVDRWGGYCVVRGEMLPVGMVGVLRGVKRVWEEGSVVVVNR
ncbi:hypothetical protein K440DRAFT_594862 [Wilcoxina mikolae CBS 423.85]|nr:hypothetical protein K440DRAFT_594862 [Wilcoxina mikolae CBS 423.85]